MKKRNYEQLQVHKQIYKKHADRYKANDYPIERSRRMMVYTAALTKAIAIAGARN